MICIDQPSADSSFSCIQNCLLTCQIDIRLLVKKPFCLIHWRFSNPSSRHGPASIRNCWGGTRKTIRWLCDCKTTPEKINQFSSPEEPTTILPENKLQYQTFWRTGGRRRSFGRFIGFLAIWRRIWRNFSSHKDEARYIPIWNHNRSDQGTTVFRRKSRGFSVTNFNFGSIFEITTPIRTRDDWPFLTREI